MKKMCPNLNKKWREALERKKMKPYQISGLEEGCVAISNTIVENVLSSGSKGLPAGTPSVIENRSSEQQQQSKKGLVANRKKYSCSNCNRGFIYFKRALQCCKTVNRKFSFTCDKCKTVITNKQNVGRHKVRCANIMAVRSKKNAEGGVIRKFTCELCGKDFDYKQSLKKHKMTIHKIEKEKGTYQCDLCTYSSDSKVVVKKHKTQVHPSSSKQYFCDSCDSSFYSRQGLLRHKLCAHCDKQSEVESARCPSFSANAAPSNETETMHKEGVSSSETESDETDTEDTENSEDNSPTETEDIFSANIGQNNRVFRRK